MKALILTVVFAIAQAAPPVPGQAPNNATGSRQKIQDGGQNGQTPSPSPLIVNPSERKSSQNPGRSPSRADAEQKPIPVSVVITWWDYLYVIFTGLLVSIAGIGTIIACRTLRTLEKQTSAAKEAAEATLLYAKSFVEAQRARLMVSFAKPEPGMSPEFTARIKNVGLVPAECCLIETWIEVTANPFRDFSPSANYTSPAVPMTVYPNAVIDPLIDIPLGRPLLGSEGEGLRDGRLIISIRLRIRYKDAFHPSVWQNFGFFPTHEGFEYLPKYNDSGES